MTQRRLRRILRLCGYDIRVFGRPGPGDVVAVWGDAPSAARGVALAARSGAGLLRIEDAFLRSLRPGRAGKWAGRWTGRWTGRHAGEPPIGLTIDARASHFDAAHPSELELLLRGHPLNDIALLARAEGLIARLRETELTKYAAVAGSAPAPGYVLVVDQLRGDASVRGSGADGMAFRRMLDHARHEHPGARILIKTHPETRAGLRPGYFSAADTGDRVTLLETEVSPWALLAGAVAVYTVSSQLGFEAILAGHHPHVFGLPFYAGWGLSEDRSETPLPPGRRGRTLSAAQLAAAALVLYPVWYDPCRDRLCEAEDAVEALAARARAWREDRNGWQGINIRLWKRRDFQHFFGRERAMRFGGAARGRRLMRWGAGPGDVRVEDGFLRSAGLGAALVPPLSLVLDDLGIYYDPSRESRLERLIAERAMLRPDQLRRAAALIARLRTSGLSKYNTGGAVDLADLPPGRRVLVAGQVADDASVLLGAGAVRDNAALLAAARAAHPDAVILYKPHPDVEAGLRPGAIDAAAADRVIRGAAPGALLDAVDEVWTMTSLLGFEALVRRKRVVVLGQPFYAGWGLTQDLGAPLPRRGIAVSLAGLVHAALIDYPRYRDPVSGLPCPVEVVVDRLAAGLVPRRPALRLLARAQGWFASYSWLWR